MKILIREPLLYFLVLGGLLFVLFQQVSDNEFSDAGHLEEILVTQGRIQALVLGFEKIWQRQPSEQELDGLIEEFVKEEVLYREALAMGLDQDDPIVRRRMSQKISFLSEDLAALEEPEETELQDYLDANPESYRTPSRFSFRQVYLNPGNHGQNTENVAMELLTVLQTNDFDAAELGDTLMLPHQYINESEREISRALGQQFLEGLRQIDMGGWRGPIASGFGLHLVSISAWKDGEAPDLDAVRDVVFRDWASEKRKQTNAAFYQALRKRYKVTVSKVEIENTTHPSFVKVEN